MSLLLNSLAGRPPNERVVQTASEELSAGELCAATVQLAEALRRAGARCVGLLAENSLAWVVADLACQVAGLPIVPLPPFFADGQLRASIRDAGIDMLLTDAPERATGLAVAMQRVAAPESNGLSLMRLQAATPGSLPPGTAKVTFTSGSTGAPRGVCLSTAQQLNVVDGLRATLGIDAPVHLCLLPLSTLLENVGGVYYPLLTGGRIVIPTHSSTGFSGQSGLDTAAMLETLDRYRPTSIILLPQMLVGLVAAMREGWRPPRELRFAAVGGGKSSAGLLTEARQAGLPVFEGYGLSEVASVACINTPAADRIGTVGRPLPHLTIDTVADELVLRGNTFLGYVGQPDTWGQDVLYTGDLGHIDADGFVTISGRSKNILVSSFGRNISPEWVESELLRQPQIAECVVFGDDRPYCTALIATAVATDSDAGVQQAIDVANAGLPDYARIKRWWRLPQRLSGNTEFFTANGRPRRPAIATAYAGPLASLYPPPCEAYVS